MIGDFRFSSSIQDPGFRMKDFGIQDEGFGIQDEGFGIQDERSGISDSRHSSSGGAPPPAFATSCWLILSVLNFCALAMILSIVASKSNDVAFEKRV